MLKLKLLKHNCYTQFSAVEQWPARRAHNPEVEGSNPSRATNFKLNTNELLQIIRRKT